jgi:hypothetical protein
MKKQLLLLLSITLSTLTFAQSKISFGVNAGLSYAGMRGDAVNNLDNLLNFSNGAVTPNNVAGFYAGAHVILPVAGTVSIQPGLYYTEKGYGLTGSLNIKGVGFLGASAKATLLSQYVDIPVLLKVDLGGFQIFAGPQFSYLMKADLKAKAGILGINLLNSTIDATQQFNRWDAAITGGIGYKFGNGINISASYDYGLSRLDANQSTNAYNQGFKIGVGIDL